MSTKSFTNIEKRIWLSGYCRDRVCNDCELHFPVCRCGTGTSFLSKSCDGTFEMTEKEISDAYKVVTGNTEEAKVSNYAMQAIEGLACESLEPAVDTVIAVKSDRKIMNVEIYFDTEGEN